MSTPEAVRPALIHHPDPEGELVFASDAHRRVLAHCNRGIGITFNVLLDRVAKDPWTTGIGPHDQARLGQIIADLTTDGDVVQKDGGVLEATPEGWFKITNIEQA